MNLKKVLSAILILSLCLSMAPFPHAASAAEETIIADAFDEGAPLSLRWQAEKLLRGYADGSMQLERPLTRAEFAAFLLRIKPSNKKADLSSYKDVRPGAWYYDVLSAAVAEGYLVNKGDGIMDPNAPITVQEAVAIAMRCVDKNSKKPKWEQKTLSKLVASADDWAKSTLIEALAEGFYKVEKGALEWSPTDNISRGDVIRLLDRIHLDRRTLTVAGTYYLNDVPYLQVASGNITLVNTKVSKLFVVPVKATSKKTPVRLIDTALPKQQLIGEDNVIIKETSEPAKVPAEKKVEEKKASVQKDAEKQADQTKNKVKHGSETSKPAEEEIPVKPEPVKPDEGKEPLEEVKYSLYFKDGDSFTQKKNDVVLHPGESFDPATLVLGLQKNKDVIVTVPFEKWAKNDIQSDLTAPYVVQKAGECRTVTISHAKSKASLEFVIRGEEAPKTVVSAVSLAYSIDKGKNWTTVEGLTTIAKADLPKGATEKTLASEQHIVLPQAVLGKTLLFRLMDADGRVLAYTTEEKIFNGKEIRTLAVESQALKKTFGPQAEAAVAQYQLELDAETPQVQDIVLRSISLEAIGDKETVIGKRIVTDINQPLDAYDKTVVKVPHVYKSEDVMNVRAVLTYEENGEEKTVEKILSFDGFEGDQSFKLDGQDVFYSVICVNAGFKSIAYTFSDEYLVEPAADAEWHELSLPDIDDILATGNKQRLIIDVDDANSKKYINLRYTLNYPDDATIDDKTELLLAMPDSMKMDLSKGKKVLNLVVTSPQGKTEDNTFSLIFQNKNNTASLMYPEFTPPTETKMNPGSYIGETKFNYVSPGEVRLKVRLHVDENGKMSFSEELFADDSGIYHRKAKKIYTKLDSMSAAEILEMAHVCKVWAEACDELRLTYPDTAMLEKARVMVGDSITVTDNLTRDKISGPVTERMKAAKEEGNLFTTVCDTCSGATFSGVGLAMAAGDAVQRALDGASDQKMPIGVYIVKDSYNVKQLTHTDKIDLSSLRVTVNYNDGDRKIVPFEDFAKEGIELVNTDLISRPVVEDPSTIDLADYINKNIRFAVRIKGSEHYESETITIRIVRAKEEMNAQLHFQVEGADKAYVTDDLSLDQIVLPEEFEGQDVLIRIITDVAEWPTIPVIIEGLEEPLCIGTPGPGADYVNTWPKAEPGTISFNFNKGDFFSDDKYRFKRNHYTGLDQTIRDYDVQFGETTLTEADAY